jgi:hypothetical protein
MQVIKKDFFSHKFGILNNLTLYCTANLKYRYAGYSTGIETCSLQHDNSFVYDHSRKGGAVSHILPAVFHNRCGLTLEITAVNKMLTPFKTCYNVKVIVRFILKTKLN